LGHTLGAAGAIDAVLAVLSLRSGRVVPLRHLETLDAECDVKPALAPDQPALRNGVDGKCAVLVNSFAFGGHNVSLLLGPAPANENPPAESGR